MAAATEANRKNPFMPVIKIKVCDDSGAPITGQSVKVTGCEELISNDEGMTQFLLLGDAPVDIAIQGVAAWSGAVSDLNKEETFIQSGATFTRD